MPGRARVSATSTRGDTGGQGPNAIVIGALLVSLAARGAGPAAAQSSNEKPKATEVGVTATEIHIARRRRRRQPVRTGSVQGRGRRREGRRRVPEQQGRRRRTRRPQGRRRLLRLEAQRQRVAQRHHPGLRERLRAGGHVGAVPDPGRRTSSTARTRRARRPGIPDMSAVTTGVPESCSAMSFPAFGTAARLRRPSTQNPQTFYANQGPAKWELSKNKGGLHGVTIVGQRHQGRRPRRHDPRPWPRRRRASRPTRATPWWPCRDVTRRACSRPSCRR